MTEQEVVAAVHALNKAQEHYEHDINKYGGGNHMSYTPVEYASKGIAGSGLGLGIAGTALALLNNGGLGGIFNGGCKQNYVTEKELSMAQELAAKDAKIGLLEADKYADQKIAETFAVLDGKIEKLRDNVNAVNLNQATLNATNTATIACIQGQVAQILSLTKLVVPNGSVCPGWGNVTVAPEAAAA